MSKKCNVKYYPVKNKVIINANSTDFYPAYVKYLFEYLKIPANAKIVLNNKTFEKGLEEWLKE